MGNLRPARSRIICLKSRNEHQRVYRFNDLMNKEWEELVITFDEKKKNYVIKIE